MTFAEFAGFMLAIAVLVWTKFRGEIHKLRTARIALEREAFEDT